VFRAIFVVGVVVLFILITILSWGPSAASRKPRQSADQTPPAVELKLDLASPIEAVALAAQPPLGEAMAAVADAVEAKATLLGDSAQQAMLRAHRYWADPRSAGEGGAVGAARNWELHFGKGIARDEYARELDFFGIELAVIMPDNQLVYASDFSKPKHTVRTAPADEEQRCYLTWQGGDLSRADRELLARAGIKAGSRVVVTILPREVESKLAELEKQAAGSELDKVRRTRFGVRAEGNGYTFYVVEQFRRE
jgi:hypothetical protein